MLVLLLRDKHNSYSQTSTNNKVHFHYKKNQPKIHKFVKPRRSKDRSNALFCISNFKTNNKVLVNNLYSGLSAGTAAISLGSQICVSLADSL